MPQTAIQTKHGHHCTWLPSEWADAYLFRHPHMKKGATRLVEGGAK